MYVLKNMKLVILFNNFLNPNFKMTSFANIARMAASTFINLLNLPDQIIRVYFLITRQLLKLCQTLFERKLFWMFFSKPVLSFVFCFSLSIYILPWPASFSWLIKYYATKYGLILLKYFIYQFRREAVYIFIYLDYY